ncbi:MAG: hypothetical protein PHX83_12090 [Acidobacteriia bacterium]|nr:hypothetical protein [Terriglobia bacterium]
MKEFAKKYGWIVVLVLVIAFGFGRVTAPQHQVDLSKIGKVSEARVRELLISYADALNTQEKANLQLNNGLSELVKRLQALKSEPVNQVLAQFGVK